MEGESEALAAMDEDDWLESDLAGSRKNCNVGDNG